MKFPSSDKYASVRKGSDSEGDGAYAIATNARLYALELYGSQTVDREPIKLGSRGHLNGSCHVGFGEIIG